MGAREKQVLVTGVSCFVGSNLVRSFPNESTKRRAIYWKRSEAAPKLSGIESVRCNLTDRARKSCALGQKLVFRQA